MTANTGETASTASARSSPTEEVQADIPADTFAARLVLSRHHAGRLSIEQAAARCGLNSGNWANWESGRLPRDRVDVAQAVSTALGISFDWLLLGGPLLPARGKPVKRTSPVTGGYRKLAEWANGHQPNGRPRTDAVTKPARRPRLIQRALLVAA